MIHFIVTYAIGVVITLFVLHKWKKELNIDDYDNHDDNDWGDDWDSNAQAYAFWSLGWPIVLAFFVGAMLWKAIFGLSKWIQARIDKPTQVFIKSFTLGDLTIKFVLRHYWEKPDPNNIWTRKYDFRRKELGFWYDKRMAVGTTKKGIEAFKKSNLYPSYMFGVNFLYIKFWITVDRKVLHINLEK
jgi:hypothetical protein